MLDGSEGGSTSPFYSLHGGGGHVLQLLQRVSYSLFSAGGHILQTSFLKPSDGEASHPVSLHCFLLVIVVVFSVVVAV